MIPIWGHADIVAAFVAQMIDGCERGFGPCEAMGVVDGDRLVAGVVYHNWYPEAETIELSAASVDKRWLTRPVLRAMFAYPYDTLGCQLTVFRVHPGNLPMRRMLRAIGGTETVIPRLRGRDTAEVVVTVTEEAWRTNRFSRESHAQTDAEPARAGRDAAAGAPSTAGAGASA